MNHFVLCSTWISQKIYYVLVSGILYTFTQNKPLRFAEVKIIQIVWLAHLAPQNKVVRFAGMKYINVWLACLAP